VRALAREFKTWQAEACPTKTMPDVTRQQIADRLRQIGVQSGESLLVHSSLSSFGHVVGGAATVVEALLEVAGPDGTVFVPTFNFGKLPFDSATTRSLTGAISESLRTMPGAIRSPHPTHPFSGIGPQAALILSEHPLMRPFGKGSPIWRLWEENAQVLLLGCDHRSSSMIHVAEVQADVPYLNRTRIIKGSEQQEITVIRPPCSNHFNIIDAPLRSGGHIQETQIGQARVLLMRAADIVTAALKLLAQDVSALTCADPQCEFCIQSRAMIAAEKKI
jgi:aminoglycoside 3-N-acetyltransferase